MNFVIIPYITPFDYISRFTYISHFACEVENVDRFRKFSRRLCPFPPITERGLPYIYGEISAYHH